MKQRAISNTQELQKDESLIFFPSTSCLSQLFYFAACSSGCWRQIVDSFYPIPTICQ